MLIPIICKYKEEKDNEVQCVKIYHKHSRTVFCNS